MASRDPTLDEAGIESSLASLTTEPPCLFDNNDVMPFPRAQPEVQDESEATTSDSSSTRRKAALFKSRAKKVRKSAHQTQASKPALRPAKDILSRLRHDPALDESDYVVGYHDRHADVMEMDLSAWKGGGDVTDEEWIPQHRILYFRKKGDEDGRRIWDRAARLDRLFGSGVIVNEQLHDGVVTQHVNQDASSEQKEGELLQQAGGDDKCKFTPRVTLGAGEKAVRAPSDGSDET